MENISDIEDEFDRINMLSRRIRKEPRVNSDEHREKNRYTDIAPSNSLEYTKNN